MLLGAAALARAETTVDPLIQDHCVLQRDRALEIRGSDAPRQRITVRCAGQSAEALAGEDGRWVARLQPLTMSVTPQDLTVAGSTTRTITDILVGDVWLCSGQSNMEFVIQSVADSARECAAADHPLIRWCPLGGSGADQPQRTITAAWYPVTPPSISGLSAVAYFFAREIHARLGVPIGVIRAAVSGSCAEAWTDRESLLGDPALAPIIEAAARNQPPYQGVKPSSLYNGLIAPLEVALTGIVWYQGEANVERASGYRALLTGLITGWRTHFAQGDLPFLIVQLPNFGEPAVVTARSPWAELREAQDQVAHGLSRVYDVCTVDIGEAANLHPRNKQDVGKRLGAMALRSVYGQDAVVATGPVFEDLAVSGANARVDITTAGGDPAVRGGGALEGFAIAGADGVFVPAQARLVGGSVELSAASVAAPTAVRYGWADNPIATLVGPTGLPAVPFRTDAPRPPFPPPPQPKR